MFQALSQVFGLSVENRAGGGLLERLALRLLYIQARQQRGVSRKAKETMQ